MPDIVRAEATADFAEALEMMAEMGQWDVAEPGKLGFPTEGLLDLCYPEPLPTLEATFTAPQSALLLAKTDSVISGILGIKAVEARLAEISKFYVQPAFRGRSFGALLLRTMLDFARLQGFNAIRLETARFMTSVIAIYAAHGFSICEPYYDVPAEYAGLSIFMRCDLA